MNLERIYDLHLLGWHSFQQLCHTITREILGQTVEKYLDTNDGGRDGAFSGSWKSIGGEEATGKFVIQCKFFSKRDSVIKVSDLKEEFEKIKKLVSDGICEHYIIMTNGGITGPNAKKIIAKVKDQGVKTANVYGSSWIGQQIHENKKLRMLVPRIYGLGDLSEILDERAYSQARALLHSMREDLSKVVITEAYRKASLALDEHGIVLLVGEAAAGKTTIASMLAMAALDMWGLSTIKADTASTVKARWNPENPSQLFWLDDAFGITQYELGLVNDWNRVLPDIKAMLDQGIKIVMTSRDYIYTRARHDLKESAFPLLNESQVVIDVKELSSVEKDQILYNHLRLGKQKKEYLAEIKEYLPMIASHKSFIPEIARRLGDPAFTKELYLANHTISEFVSKPLQFLKDVLRGLDNDCKAALALIYMRNDSLESPIELQSDEEKALIRLGSDVSGCITALKSMDGSFVQYVTTDGDLKWRYKHPTIGDAYASILAENPELLNIYITGTEPSKLVGQITCGDVGLEKATVVPAKLFEEIILKLDGFKTSKTYKLSYLSDWNVRKQILNFLSRRSSPEFLQLYLSKKPDFLNDFVLKLSSYLKWSEELDLILKLAEYNILDEASRQIVMENLYNYAADGDFYALEEDSVKMIFTDTEYEDFKERVRIEILPRLNRMGNGYQDSYRRDEDAEEHMEGFIDGLGILEEAFEDEASLKIISSERSRTKAWIEDNHIARDEIAPRKMDLASEEKDFETSRSIFDDIAE